jgi:hypothetical protein
MYAPSDTHTHTHTHTHKHVLVHLDTYIRTHIHTNTHTYIRRSTFQQTTPASTKFPLEHAVPTIEGIKQNGHGSAPFQSFFQFWCGSQSSSKPIWHCTYNDILQQHGNNALFYQQYPPAIQRKYSRAKMVLEIIHDQACTPQHEHGTKVDKMVCNTASNQWAVLSKAAGQLDLEYQRSSILTNNWEHFVDSKRSIPRRAKPNMIKTSHLLPVPGSISGYSACTTSSRLQQFGVSAQSDPCPEGNTTSQTQTNHRLGQPPPPPPGTGGGGMHNRMGACMQAGMFMIGDPRSIGDL